MIEEKSEYLHERHGWWKEKNAQIPFKRETGTGYQITRLGTIWGG